MFLVFQYPKESFTLIFAVFLLKTGFFLSNRKGFEPSDVEVVVEHESGAVDEFNMTPIVRGVREHSRVT